MIDKIATKINDNSIAYLYELLLAVQLGAVVGMDKLYDAYFVDHNLDKVKQLLNMYLNDEDKTNDFFKDFEFAYSNRQKNNDLSMLGKLQSTLVYALKKKDVDNNYLNNFKKYIITPDLIIKREKEYKDIPLLQESIDLIEFMISKRDI